MPDGRDNEGNGAEPEEAEGGTLALDPELAAALREATESVEAREAERPAADEGAADPADEAAPAGGEASDEAAAPTEAGASELQEQLAGVEAEKAALSDRLIRLQADFENHRKRALREHQDSLRYGHENLVKDLLGTVDNLERAIDHASQSDGGDLQAMLQGVELVQRELLATLDQHAVKEIEAAGGMFDPNVHEAMAQVEDPERPTGTIVEVLQKGYQLRDRLLRPARVVVAKAPAEVPKPDDSEEDETDETGDETADETE